MDPNEESVQLFLYVKGEEKVTSSEYCNFEGNNSVCYDTRRCYDSESKQ